MVTSKVEVGDVSNSSGLRHRWSRYLPGAVLAGSLLVWSAPAEAAVYNVYTSSTISAMTKNASDGYCSLAEAVDSVNSASPPITIVPRSTS